MNTMFGSSLGAFRSALASRVIAAEKLRNPATQTLIRNMSYARPSNMLSSQWRATSARTSHGLLRRLEGPSAFSKASQQTGAFRSSRQTFHWSRARRSQSGAKGEEAEPQSLSARLRKLSREYGWAAVGVYLGLSVLDFPFCFLLVRTVGTDRIGMSLLAGKMCMTRRLANKTSGAQASWSTGSYPM